MAGTKRKLEWDISEMEEGSNATVHGVVTSLSPVKASRNDPTLHYFDGRMTDGKKSARMVFFDPSARNILETAREKQQAVSVVNCLVKQNKDKDSIEILANNRSKIVPSPRKYVLPELSTIAEHKTVQLREVDDVSCSQKVTVLVKVNNLAESEVVSSREGVQVRKQDCYVGDCSGSVKLVLWEEDVGSMKTGMSYKTEDAVVKSFDGVKYLSVGKTSDVKAIDDIGEVMEADEEEENELVVDRGSAKRGCEVIGEINGVMVCSEYLSCISCKSKVKELNELIGECSKCRMVVKKGKCSSSSMAKVLIGDRRDAVTICLKM